ncbi:MAG: RecX family transcriptional regulator [Butyrivibrio sp.]|nr:RecX family transcriptional regulator [Butyrivibrio sp.]
MGRSVAGHPPRTAVQRALSLLEQRDYTEQRLRDKLHQSGYSTEETEDALAQMRAHHYIDDERYARYFAETHLADRSIGRIRQDLMNRGIDRDIIALVLEEVCLENPEHDAMELEQACDILRKKHPTPEQLADYAGRQKLMALLIRKGYSLEIAREALDRCYNSAPYQH